MRLVQLQVHAQGSAEEKQLQFGKHLNIIYGPSGSGKSGMCGLIGGLDYQSTPPQFKATVPGLTAATLLYHDGEREHTVPYAPHMPYYAPPSGAWETCGTPTRDVRSDSTATQPAAPHAPQPTEADPASVLAANLDYRRPDHPIYHLEGCCVSSLAPLLTAARSHGIPIDHDFQVTESLEQLVSRQQQLQAELTSLPGHLTIEELESQRKSIVDESSSCDKRLGEIRDRRERELSNAQSRLDQGRRMWEEANRRTEEIERDKEACQAELVELVLSRKQARFEALERRRGEIESIEAQKLRWQSFYHEMDDRLRSLELTQQPASPCSLESADHFCEREQLLRCIQETQAMIDGLGHRADAMRQELAAAEESDDVLVHRECTQCGMCVPNSAGVGSVDQFCVSLNLNQWNDQIETLQTKFDQLTEFFAAATEYRDQRRGELTDLEAEVALLQDRTEEQELEKRIEVLTQNIHDVDVQLEVARRQVQLRELLMQLAEDIEVARSVRAADETLALASKLLAQVTDNEWEQLHIGSDGVAWLRGSTRQLDWDNIASGTRGLVSLCLALALAQRLHEAGYRRVINCDDLFIQIDSEREFAVAKLLEQQAMLGQQILVWTRHRQVSSLFSQNVTYIDLSLKKQPEVAPVAPPPVVKRTKRLVKRVTVWDDNLPVSSLPVISPDQSDQLAVHEIHTLQDLILFDLEQSEIDDQDELAYQIPRWQTHAALVCFVPGLLGSDAILLMACGYDSPELVAEADGDVMCEEIDRFFAQGVRTSVTRLRHPSAKRQNSWIRGARRYLPRWRKRRQQHATGTDARRPRAERFARPLPDEDRGDYTTDRRQPDRRQSERRQSDHGRSDTEQKIRYADVAGGSKFYLELNSPVVDAPSIGPKSAEFLEQAGVYTAQDLLEAEPDRLAQRIDRKRITAERIEQWQNEANWVYRVPQMRGHDAQILVACEILEPDELSQMDPHTLWGRIEPFVRSKKGQRIIRNGKEPDLEEIHDWIAWAQNARQQRAA